MIVRKAAFLTSQDRLRDFPGRGRPEIALAGRSNVGKSSLINCVTGNGHLARTSAEPGKTRLVNLYDMDGRYILADLPGYGFAKAPKQEKAKWAAMIEGYLAGSGNIAAVMLLVDIRHDPTDDDRAMAEYIRHYGFPFRVIATKCDKVSRGARAGRIQAVCRALAVQPWQVTAFSAQDATGRDDVIRAFSAFAGGEGADGEQGR